MTTIREPVSAFCAFPSDAARSLLAEEGYDPTFGARPLKRVLQGEVQDPLALRLLQGDFAEGDRVRVAARDGRLTFERVAEATPEA
jgi:ATP-dependent Clp protease ATP-binding subunit ClpB